MDKANKMIFGFARRLGARNPGAFLAPCAASLAAVLFSQPALCAETELMASWEGGPSNGYAAVSPSIDFPLDTTSSLVLAPTGTYSYYDVHEGGGITKVKSPGASVGLDYKYSDDSLTFDVGPAFQVLWEDRKSSKGTKRTVTPKGWAANADLSYQFSELTSFDVSGSYEQTDRYYFMRTDLEERIAHSGSLSWLIGPEGTLEGNNQFHQLGGGAVTELVFDDTGTSLQLRGGYARVDFNDGTSQSRPYVGVALDQKL
jgi:hypothetical protein